MYKCVLCALQLTLASVTFLILHLTSPIRFHSLGQLGLYTHNLPLYLICVHYNYSSQRFAQHDFCHFLGPLNTQWDNSCATTFKGFCYKQHYFSIKVYPVVANFSSIRYEPNLISKLSTTGWRTCSIKSNCRAIFFSLNFINIHFIYLYDDDRF